MNSHGMSRTLALVGMGAAFVVLAAPAGAVAQTGLGSGFPIRISAEIRGGLNFPGEGFRDGELESGGPSLGGALGVDFTDNVSGQLDFTRAILSCEEGGPDGEDPTSDGLGAVLAWTFAGFAGVRPWLGGGAIFHTLEQDIEGAEEVESDDGFGFQLGVGATVPLGETVAVAPALRYYRYDAEYTTLGLEDTVSWLQADVGLRVTFIGR